MSFVSGAMAGAAATIASYPFDILRTTLAAQGEPKVDLEYYCLLPLLPWNTQTNVYSSVVQGTHTYMLYIAAMWCSVTMTDAL